MMSAIATQPKTRSTSKRMSSTSISRVMTPIPEHQQQSFVATRQPKPKIKAAKREDDIPLALLAYKKGYTTIHPTTIAPEEKRLVQLTTTTTTLTGTNRSRESSTSNRSILKQQKNTTDRQHRDNKSNSEITMVATTNRSHSTKKKNRNSNKSRAISSTSSLSPPSSTFSTFSSSSSSTPSSSHPPSLLPTKPHVDRPDKTQTQPLTKYNELIFTKLKRWFSLRRISNKIKSL